MSWIRRKEAPNGWWGLRQQRDWALTEVQPAWHSGGSVIRPLGRVHALRSGGRLAGRASAGRASCGVLLIVRRLVCAGWQVEPAAGDVVEGGVEVDADVAAAEAQRGQAGGRGAAERVEHQPAGWAAGGDAAQRDIDGEGGEVGFRQRPGGQAPYVAGVASGGVGG